MTLPEIFVQLPDYLQAVLESGLEGCSVPLQASAQATFQATTELISDIKGDWPHESEEDYVLLDQVPQAIVDLLF